MNRAIKIAKGLAALGILVALVAGIPWALWHYVGWPLPHGLPSWSQVHHRPRPTRHPGSGSTQGSRPVSCGSAGRSWPPRCSSRSPPPCAAAPLGDSPSSARSSHSSDTSSPPSSLPLSPSCPDRVGNSPSRLAAKLPSGPTTPAGRRSGARERSRLQRPRHRQPTQTHQPRPPRRLDHLRRPAGRHPLGHCRTPTRRPAAMARDLRPQRRSPPARPARC